MHRQARQQVSVYTFTMTYCVTQVADEQRVADRVVALIGHTHEDCGQLLLVNHWLMGRGITARCCEAQRSGAAGQQTADVLVGRCGFR